MLRLANIKKQYIAFAMFAFIMLFFFNSKPAIQCQFREPRVTLSSEQVFISYPPASRPTIYGVTPTYARVAQKADLTRLLQTLMHLKDFHWIVVEDSETKTKLVNTLLTESPLNYTHLNVKTSKGKKRLTASGVEQRNAALHWLRGYLNKSENKRGFLYFMDDDNTYSLKLFDEIRKVKRVGVWPVGLAGGLRVERPYVKDGKVTGYNALWKPFRPFSIDMAGFAINVTLLLDHPEARFSRSVQSGFQESEILKYFAKTEDLEPLADDCTKVYVWHTRTQRPAIRPHPVTSDEFIEV